METDRSEERDDFFRGYHGIPDKGKLSSMSFAELAAELASCEKDSPKFQVVERELKKHLAKDQAKINLRNILVGAGIAGIFTLLGAFVGGSLKACPSCQQIAPSKTVYGVEKGNLSVNPTVTDIPLREPSVGDLRNNSTPVQNNAHPGKP